MVPKPIEIKALALGPPNNAGHKKKYLYFGLNENVLGLSPLTNIYGSPGFNPAPFSGNLLKFVLWSTPGR